MGGDGLIICIHGEFEEYDPKTGSVGKRSFSRTFVLGPGRPGNWPVRVVSDMLSLRAYSPLPNIYPVADNNEAAPPPQATVADAETRQAMMAELSKRTGLTMQYAELCLVQVEWSFDRALVVFEEKKVSGVSIAIQNVNHTLMVLQAQLPSEAWIAPIQAT
jgi:nuclear RNA export factor